MPRLAQHSSLLSVLVFIVHSSPWHQERVEAPGAVLLAARGAEVSEGHILHQVKQEQASLAGRGRVGFVKGSETPWLHQLLKGRKNTVRYPPCR